jgi:signal transduction histidine kinase
MMRGDSIEARKVPFRSSIHAKLIGLTAIVIAGIVGFLTWFFPLHELAALEETQQLQVASYGALLSGQVRSAVAFSDRETAREVLSSLDADPDVVSTVLFDEAGHTLYEHGAPSPWVERARVGVRSPKRFSMRDRVAIVVPVESLEGPRGTLVIELSTQRVIENQRDVIATAVAIGVVVLLLGVLAASLIARSFVRRLRDMGEVASAIAEDSAMPCEIAVDKRDELGVFATALNQMLAKLHAKQARLTATVDDLTAAEDELAVANRELEHRVEQRTAELYVEMERRTKVELELRQAQKLESVGRLAAGVAHEINTPIQFVSDSVQFSSDAVTDLFKVLDAQRAVVERVLASDPGDPTATAAVAVFEAADLAYLSGELPLALDRALDGINRVAVIVRSMKVFAHPNSQLADVDLNTAIASTLTIARNEYKYVADLEATYGDLPPVSCHGGEINQAVLNILLNSAHAVADVVAASGTRGRITVRTSRDRDAAVIAIADTGGGIPDSIRDQIFDPFFTTKSVGRGTGQGLAIARSVIVDKHRGSLTFQTEPGVGTTFFLRIPIQQPMQKQAT